MSRTDDMREWLDAPHDASELVCNDDLRALLDVVDAARVLADEAARAATEPRRFHENEDDRQQALGQRIASARLALDKWEAGHGS